MSLTVHAQGNRQIERTYVLDLVLKEWLGLDYRLEPTDVPGVRITLDGDPSTRAVWLPDILLASTPTDWLSERSIPDLPLRRLDAPSPDNGRPLRDLPILFGAAIGGDQLWQRSANKIELGVDVFGSVFFLVSRYEEVVRRSRDSHGRFPSSASLAGLNGLVDRPIADEYVDLLWAALRAVWPELIRKQTPFRLRLTHDVDEPWATLNQPVRAVLHAVAGDLTRRRDPALAARRIRAAADARSGRVDRDPFDTFDLLMSASERHGLQSTFYVMAGNQAVDRDFRYRVDDPHILRLLRQIHDRGHEIGLHASYDSYLSPELTTIEFQALRRACATAGFEQATWGVRQHYLRFQIADTWRNHEAAGFEHDSTLGFADAVGFRSGTCREFTVFDVEFGRRLALRERPLIAMDATLFGYLGLDPSAAAEAVRSAVETCRRHHGDAVILYHNSSLPGLRLRRHYDQLVDAIAVGHDRAAPSVIDPRTERL